jgi:hypothetical protein
VFGQLDSEGRSTNGSSEPGRTDVEIFLAENWQVSSSVADTFIFGQASSIDPFVSAQSSAPGTFTMIPNTDSSIFEFDLSTGEISGLLQNIDVSAFLGNDAIDFTFSTDARTNIFNQVQAGSGSFTNEFSTGAWGRIVAEFEFTPSAAAVPAPGTVGLFGVAAMALVMSRRKSLRNELR